MPPWVIGFAGLVLVVVGTWRAAWGQEADKVGGEQPATREATGTDTWAEFQRLAAERHGVAGAQAAAFLKAHRPAGDSALPTSFLLENLELALRAREQFAWCRALSDSQFHNDVLPYAMLDESREAWRRPIHEIAREIVENCRTATEAAQALNQKFFDRVGVHYDTTRSRPNAGPLESMREQKATCTGLSLLLVAACRSVGIPARVAGIAEWPHKAGNHTWVEVWDGAWRFTGADEYDAKGLDRAWFVDDAAKSTVENRLHSVWASSWQRADASFPLAWDPESTTVNAVNVTARYAAADPTPERVEPSILYVRAFESVGGTRLSLTVAVLNGAGDTVSSVTTNADRSDLNDMPKVTLQAGETYRLRVRRATEFRTVLHRAKSGTETLELVWDRVPSTPPDDAAILMAEARERLTVAQFRPATSAVQAWIEGDSIICHRTIDGDPIQFVTFEREGPKTAYGVYGLGLAKNPMMVPRPLHGQPITYPDRDHAATIVSLLLQAGVDAAAVQEVMRDHEESWFAEGLRVFFVVDPGLAAALFPNLPASDSRPLLLHVELSPPR